VGCEALSKVMDGLFADLKGNYVFHFLDDLVVFQIYRRASDSPTGGVGEVREGGFTLNPEKKSVFRSFDLF
jgi:hypothetical protein